MKKNNFFLIIGIISIIIGGSASVYAGNYLLNGYEVSYDNSSTGISSEKVQGAVDELYNYADNYSNIKNRLNNIKNNFLNKTYPIGSIYMSTTEDTAAKVQTKFGGTWEKIEGRFLLSSSSSYTAGSTGGSANAVVVSHSHTFTGTAATSGGPSANPTYTFTGTKAATEGAGSHSHTLPIMYSGAEAKGYGLGEFAGFRDRIVVTGNSTSTNTVTNAAHNYTPSGSVAISGNTSHTHSVTAKGTISTNGEDGTGKNMPPYLVVYMYKRTS